MASADSEGVAIHYEDVGAGPPVVFHHGYTSTHEAWAAVIECMRPRRRCIALDARGTGDSDRPEHGYSIEQMALDVLAVADAAGLERFTFVGHSMGGVVGMQLALGHGSRLDQLVLVCPAAADGMQIPAEVRERSRQHWLARDREALLRDRLAACARASAHASITASIDNVLEVSVGHFEDAFTALCSVRFGDRLAEIATPTLVVAGAADGLLPANLRDVQRLGHATLHVFSRVGHSAPREVPADLAQVIEDFLTHGVVTAETLARRGTAV